MPDMELAGRWYEVAEDEDVQAQAEMVADSFLARFLAEKVARIDNWNAGHRSDCGCVQHDKREAGQICNEVNHALDMRFNGRQQNQFFWENNGKKIKYKSRGG